MSVSGILFVSPAAPAVGAAPPPVQADPGICELTRAVAAADSADASADAGTGGGAGAGSNAHSGTPVTAPATRSDFATGAGPTGVAPEIEIPMPRTWRMSDVMAATGGGPRAEHLMELASRPGPVEPGSLLEAIKRLRAAPRSGASRAV